MKFCYNQSYDFAAGGNSAVKKGRGTRLDSGTLVHKKEGGDSPDRNVHIF